MTVNPHKQYSRLAKVIETDFGRIISEIKDDKQRKEIFKRRLTKSIEIAIEDYVNSLRKRYYIEHDDLIWF